jgi:microcystin-dependent protein
MAIKLQVRRDTLTNWTANQTVVLLEGEIGYVTDTGNIKIGDATTQWSSLPYFQLSNVSVNPATTADLNNVAYRVMGRYRLNSISGGTTFTNTPTDLDTADANSYCTLLVTSHSYSGLSTLFQQTLTQFSNTNALLKQWVRMYDGTNWTAWSATAHIPDDSIGLSKLTSQVTELFAPIGAIIQYGGTTAPSSQWLICDGAAVNRTTYATLFVAIGVAFGSGDGSSTFNLPDLRGKFAVGKTATGYGNVLGGTGGTKDAVVVSHTHTVTSTGTNTINVTGTTSSDGDHIHGVRGGGSTGSAGYDAGPGAGFSTNTSSAGAHTHTVSSSGSNSISVSGTTASSGTSGSDQNLPPYLSINYLIRAL